MAYTDFTANDLTRRFGLHFASSDLFGAAPPLAPSPWLIDTLRKGQLMGFGSEKSRSERLVSPILTELCEHNNFAFAVVSGANLDADESRGLRGECDFVLTSTRIQEFITTPIFCITEAKRQDVEQGTIQCAAQLLGARRLNELEDNSLPVLYGCSTTGTEWRFLKLEDNTITLDLPRYYLADLSQLLGVLQAIVTAALASSTRKN